MAFLLQTASEQAILCEGKSAVTVYADIASAFAEVQKALIIPDSPSKEVLRKAAIDAGLGAELVEEIEKEITPIVCPLTVAPHLFKCLGTTCCGSCMLVRAQNHWLTL